MSSHTIALAFSKGSHSLLDPLDPLDPLDALDALDAPDAPDALDALDAPDAPDAPDALCLACFLPEVLFACSAIFAVHGPIQSSIDVQPSFV